MSGDNDCGCNMSGDHPWGEESFLRTFIGVLFSISLITVTVGAIYGGLALHNLLPCQDQGCIQQLNPKASLPSQAKASQTKSVTQTEPPAPTGGTTAPPGTRTEPGAIIPPATTTPLEPGDTADETSSIFATIATLILLFKIFGCIIVPILLVLLAWLLIEVGNWLSEKEKNCWKKKRKHWWSKLLQKLFCILLFILKWVAYIVAVLAVLEAIYLVVVCVLGIFFGITVSI